MIKNIIKNKYFLTTLVLGLIFYCAGLVFYKTEEFKYNNETKINIAKAKEVYNSLPAWHRKIKTKEVLKIGIVTDTHIKLKKVDKKEHGVDAERYFKEKKEYEMMKNELRNFQPDIIIHLGDVIEGTKEADVIGIQGLKAAKNELSQIGAPIYWVIGNHDLRSVTRQQFEEALGIDYTNKVVDKGDYRLIFLDTNFNNNDLPRSPGKNLYIRGHLPTQTFTWLEDKLNTNKTVFIFMHHGIYLGTDKKWKDRLINNSKKARALFEKYNVKAVFNGHMEILFYGEENGTKYYSLVGTKKNKKHPFSFYELTINGGEPNVTMCYIPTIENSNDSVLKKIKIENVKEFDHKGRVIKK